MNNGLGVPQNYSKAVYWLKKAAKKGFKLAKRELEHLE
jgi:TPR repeat protein